MFFYIKSILRVFPTFIGFILTSMLSYGKAKLHYMFERKQKKFTSERRNSRTKDFIISTEGMKFMIERLNLFHRKFKSHAEPTNILL